jgi:hypothetical protein
LSKKAVLTNDNFPPPKSITAENMRELIEGYGISQSQEAVTVNFLSELIELIQNDIKRGRKHNREDVRKDLADASNWLLHASKRIANSGVLGADILRRSAPHQLNTMFSEAWLNDCLPGHALLPTRSPTARIRSRLPAQTDIAEVGYYLMRAEASQILGAALSQISLALSKALEVSRQKGGRKANLYRHLFILNLAVLWEEKLGRDCRSTEGQTFRDFCTHIFHYVIWPINGLERAIDKAITDYYERINRN